MSELVVIVPSRGRPDAAAELARAFAATCTANTGLVFVTDTDDPSGAGYAPLISNGSVGLSIGVHSSMVEALNRGATQIVTGADCPFAIGFMGDDHRPRTKGWDAAYLQALRDLGTGIVYGNDLLQGPNLPTQCAMTADIIRSVGYMAPPTLTHLAVDNWWLELGRAANCIRYLRDVIIEHLHPVAGKAVWDENYRRVNSPEMYHRDLTEFERLRRTELPTAVAKVRALRAGA